MNHLHNSNDSTSGLELTDEDKTKETTVRFAEVHWAMRTMYVCMRRQWASDTVHTYLLFIQINICLHKSSMFTILLF